MPDQVGAAIGNQRPLDGGQVLAHQRQMLLHRGVTVLISVDGVTKQRQRSVLIDMHAEPASSRWGHRPCTPLSDVRGLERAVRPQVGDASFGIDIGGSFARLGLLIAPGEEDVSGVVVQVLQLDAEDFDDAQGDGGEDGVTLFEEGIERTSEAIVIPLFEGYVEDDMGESVLCPLGNVGERDGLMGASGDEDAENCSVRKVRLIIDGEMLVDDLLDAHAFEERHDDRKPSEWLAFNVGVFSVPDSVHERSLAGLGRMRKPIHYVILEGCGK